MSAGTAISWAHKLGLGVLIGATTPLGPNSELTTGLVEGGEGVGVVVRKAILRVVFCPGVKRFSSKVCNVKTKGLDRL